MNLLSLFINFADAKYALEDEVAYYMALLNDGDKDPYSMGKLEASASEDYVRKVNKMVVQRSHITFATFKDLVTNPLAWKKYRQPKHRTKKKVYRDSPAIQWRDRLGFTICGYPESPNFVYYTIPFSDTFRESDCLKIFRYINGSIKRNFKGPGACWFRILKWLEDIRYSYRILPYDEDSRIRKVVDWWRNFNPYPTTGTPPSLSSIYETASCGDNDEDTPLYLPPTHFLRTICETASRDKNDEVTPSPPPSPSTACLCTICERERASRVNNNKVTPSQPTPMDGFTRPPSPTPDLCETEGNKYDSSPLIQDAQAREIAPLPRRYRDMPREEEAEEDEEEADSLQHPRKKQKTTHIFEHLESDTESMMTDTEAGPPESSNEDDMSVYEDFWSAKSTAELSMLSID